MLVRIISLARVVQLSIEEVVTVGTRFSGWHSSSMASQDLAVFSVPGEIDALLAYPSSFCCIFGEEVGHWVDADLVVGESEYEAQDEEVLPETEHAPVDCHVASRASCPGCAGLNDRRYYHTSLPGPQVRSEMSTESSHAVASSSLTRLFCTEISGVCIV